MRAIDDPDQVSDSGRASAIAGMKQSSLRLARYLYSSPPETWDPGEIVRYAQMLAQEMIDQDLLREQQILRLAVLQARIAYLLIGSGILIGVQVAVLIGFAAALLRF